MISGLGVGHYHCGRIHEMVLEVEGSPQQLRAPE